MTELDGRPVLFVVAVYHRAVTSGRWPVIDRLPDDRVQVEIPHYFMRDQFNPESCKIIDADGEHATGRPGRVRPERAAVWDAEHVEERISTRPGRSGPRADESRPLAGTSRAGWAASPGTVVIR